MKKTLCETRCWMREVDTPKRSRFLLCQLSKTNPAYAKYPPQPVTRCHQNEQRERIVAELEKLGYKVKRVGG